MNNQNIMKYLKTKGIPADALKMTVYFVKYRTPSIHRKLIGCSDKQLKSAIKSKIVKMKGDAVMLTTKGLNLIKTIFLLRNSQDQTKGKI